MNVWTDNGGGAQDHGFPSFSVIRNISGLKRRWRDEDDEQE